MSTKQELTAPCGLDCFNCALYEKNFNHEAIAPMAKQYGKSLESLICKGCRKQPGCSCFSNCATLECVNKKGKEFCFECDEFPCPMLQPCAEEAGRFPHNIKLYNLCRIKTIGIEK